MNTEKTEFTERINSVEDVLVSLGDTDAEVIIYKKLLELFGADAHIVNYQLATLIAKAYNEGWEPDWSNGKWDKYFAWFYMGGSSGFRYGGYASWYSTSGVGSRLCFKSAELAKDAGTKFVDVFKKFMIIQK
jgi:hypothetical protein